MVILVEENGFALVVGLEDVEKGLILEFACPTVLVLKIESPRLSIGGNGLGDPFCRRV